MYTKYNSPKSKLLSKTQRATINESEQKYIIRIFIYYYDGYSYQRY